MPKWLKVILWICLSILILLGIAWGFLYYYVYVNKKPLLEKINKEASNAIHGEVVIGDLSVVFWKDFPEINLKLEDISVRDSLYDQHKRALFTAESIYIKANFPSLFTEISEVEKVTITHAEFYLFTDSNGYTNQYILKGEKEKGKEVVEKKKREIYLFFANLEHFHLLIDNQPAGKKFDVLIHEMNAGIVNTDTSIAISAPLEAHIGQLGFNLDKGAFLIDKDMKATLDILFRKPTRELVLPLQPLTIEGEEVQLGLNFNFGTKPASYEVEIYDDAIPYQKGLSFLNAHILKRLKMLSLTHPAEVRTVLKGTFKKKDKPWVRVDFRTEQNQLITDYGTVDSVSFEGFYFNNWEPELGNNDSNSVISIRQITGKYNGNIPFRGDSILVHNLKKGKTHLNARIRSGFQVAALNDLIDNTIIFKKGNASLDLQFDGNISASDQASKRSLTGFIKVDHAQMLYRPRGFDFNDVNFDLVFKGQDLELKNIDMRRGNSALHIDGTATHFMNAYFSNPEMIMVKANVYSKHIDLNDFKALLSSRSSAVSKTVSAKTRRSKMQTMNDRLENILNQGNMHLHLFVDQVSMNHFSADDVTADIDLLTNKIILNKIRVHHAGGLLDMQAQVHQNAANNPFTVSGKIENVNLDEFLAAFDNFGMESITSEHIRGKFTSSIDLRGNFTDQGELLKKSISGNVDFVLANAAFIDFFPFTEIQKYVFRNRGLDSITFWDIRNNLIIENGKVIIFPMEIRNNALNIFIKGIYGFESGTDLSIEIPLANPKKDNKRVAEGKESRRKGMKVYLRAKDDGEGGVNITWDPFKKGDDAVDAKLHLTEDGELREDAFDDPQEEQPDNGIIKADDPAGQKEKLPEKKEASSGDRNFFQRIGDFFRRTISDSGKVKDE